MMTNNNYNDGKEMLLCFDQNGSVIEPRPRGVVHRRPYKIWHAIVNIWILNKRAEILCTRRASHVSGNPGKWQTYLGGHIRSESSFHETAVRELFEEIGLKANKGDLKLVEKGKRKSAMHFYESYALSFSKDLSALSFSDSEVCEAKWLSFENYQNSKDKNPDYWCNSMSLDQYKKACSVLGL